MTEDEVITKEVFNKLLVEWGKNLRKLAEIKRWFKEHEGNIEIYNGAEKLFEKEKRE